MSDVSLAVVSPGGGPVPSSRGGSPSTTPVSCHRPKEQQQQAAAEARAAREGNVLTVWVRYRMCSRDRVERHYAFLIAMLVTASLLFAALKPEGASVLKWGAPICSVWSLALLLVTLLNLYAEQRDRSALFEWTRGIQFVLAMLSVLIYYDGSNVVNRYRFANRGEAMLYDPQLLAMDEALLGWLYPRGQLALYLDTQTTIGVTSLFGRIYAEMFQILYISYYFWGNAIGVWLAFQYFYYSVWRKNKDTKKRMQWRRIQMFVSAWVGGFVLNHLINLCFPAMSPRIFIAESFKNELKGVWMLEKLRGAVTGAAANTYSAFPSGHCGLSILAAILSFRIGLAKWYSYLVLLTTVLIVLATQVLRYHYFVDFLFSLTIVSFGAWLGGFHEKELYQRSLEVGVEEFDEDGKPMQSPGGRLESVPLLSLRTPIASSTSPDVELGQSRRESTDHDGGVLTLTTAMFGMTRSISSQAINKDKEQAYAAQQAEARAQ